MLITYYVKVFLGTRTKVKGPEIEAKQVYECVEERFEVVYGLDGESSVLI